MFPVHPCTSSVGCIDAYTRHPVQIWGHMERCRPITAPSSAGTPWRLAVGCSVHKTEPNHDGGIDQVITWQQFP
jgi:hypothetical protein